MSGKNDLELVVELRGERLVVREDQRGPADRLDDLGHRERLAGAGDAEQHLVLFAVPHAARQFRDGVFLIPARPVVDRQTKAHGSRLPIAWSKIPESSERSMAHVAVSQPFTEIEPPLPQTPRWPLAQRVIFRFLCAYLVL